MKYAIYIQKGQSTESGIAKAIAKTGISMSLRALLLPCAAGKNMHEEVPLIGTHGFEEAWFCWYG